MVFAAHLTLQPYNYMTKYFTPRIALLFLAASLAFSGLVAQTPHTITKATPKSVAPEYQDFQNRTTGVVDTIFDYFDRSTAFYELTAGTGGYTIGTNSFTWEVGVHYTSLGGPTKVTELAVFFASKQIMLGAADTIVARAYTCSADSMPDVVIGEGLASVADLDTAGFLTFIPLTIFDSTSGDFFVSIDYDDNGNVNDTVVILSNNVLTQQGGPDGFQEKRTRQLLSTGQWMRVWDVWNFGGANMDADAMIFPIIDYTQIVGVDQGLTARDLTLHRPYPNPAIDEINIPYTLKSAQQVQLTVFDVQGRPVKQLDSRAVSSGQHSLQVDLDGLAPGSYYFLLKADRGALMGKFQKVK